MRKRTLGREYALQILYQNEMNPGDLSQMIEDHWQLHPSVTPEIKEFTEALVFGTLGRLDEMNKVVEKYADNWQIHRMAVIDRNILRFAAFELLYCDDIPPKVTINEAVNIAKKFSQQDSGKFVNGILDKISHKETSRSPTL